MRLPPAVPLLALLLAPLLAGCLGSTAAPGPQTREFTLVAQETEVELYPGKTVAMWTYNGQVPGPLLRVREGDHVVIHFRNEHALPHTVHFHGAHPYEMDGDDGQAIPPGGNFTYEFTAGPAGLYAYHCHVDTPVHIPMGLYGQLLVEPREGWGAPEPDREYFLVYGEWNPHENATAETHFLNGKAFPATEPLRADVGERVRLYVTSFDVTPVALHFHGTVPQQVWPYPQPIDVVPLAAAESRVLDYVPTNPGAWMFHDHYERKLRNDGVYPGGALGVVEVGEAHWGRSKHGHGGHEAGAPPAAEVPEDAVRVEVRDYEFSPATLRVAPGTTVAWTNVGEAPHTVTSDHDGVLRSATLKPGESFVHTFEEAGTFAYHCAPHSGKGRDGSYQGMVGTVLVA